MQTDWSGWSSGGHKSRAANAGVCTSFCLLLAFIGTGSVPRETRIQTANRRKWKDFKALYKWRGRGEAKFPSQTLSDFGRDKRFGWRFSV